MVSADILKGVGLHRAHVLAVDQHLGDGVALIRGDGEGLIPALAAAATVGILQELGADPYWQPVG